MNNMFGFLSRLVSRVWSSVYESANFSPRRGRVPGAAPRDAKLDLTPRVRRELVRQSRYLYKNSGFVRELVNCMAIYSTGDGIRPQAQTGNFVWNKEAEEYFAQWSARCEVTGRFSFAECQSLVCRGMDVDGEFFVHKTRDVAGRPILQLIEAHRIGNALDDGQDCIDGVGLDTVGKPMFYRLLVDDGSYNDLVAERVLHIFEPDSMSAVRNAPSLQHSISHVLDEIELLALEKHAVKDNADIARILKTARGELDDGDFSLNISNANTAAGSDPQALQRIIGGKLVALKPDESLDSFSSNRPSPTFTGFLDHLRRDSALGMLPFEFAADSSKIGGAGVRLVVAKADRKFSFRQLILIERFVRPVWQYVVGDAIAQRRLKAEPNWWKVSCTTPRRITVDAGREAQQNRADVEMGLKTLSEHFSELGMEFEEEMRIRAQNARYILDLAAEYNIPVEMLWKSNNLTFPSEG